MDITRQNYFEIFSLPVSFEMDLEALSASYRSQQERYHPDRFTGKADSERRQSLQITSMLNEAFNTLRSPLSRAGYLLKLQGLDPEAHEQEGLGHDFLFQQMQLREQLETLVSAEDMDGLEKMKAEVGDMREELLGNFVSAYDRGDYETAKPVYNKLQFVYKLLAEINQAEEKILDY